MDNRQVFKEYVRAISTGDKGALSAAMAMVSGRVRGIAFGVLRDGDACEDVLSECIIMVWRRAEELARLKNPLGYVYVSAYNRAVSMSRKNRGLPGGLPESLPAPDGASDLRLALSALPDDLREILLLRAAHGYNFRELAGITGLTLRQVYLRFQKAKKLLRHELEEH